MANTGLFKLMITLVIYMLGGVRGKLFGTKTTAGVSDKSLQSLLQTRCAIILDASFELGATDIQDYSVLWDSSLNNLPTSKLAIGLRKHHLIEALEEVGFSTQHGSFAHEVKMCRFICEGVERCKSVLLWVYKRRPGSKLVYSPTETVEVTTFAGKTKKIMFQYLSEPEQENLLLDRYVQRLKKIARWQATTDEDHFNLYETESINIKTAKCLDKWKANVLHRNNFCTTVGFLLATRAYYLSFTGENACLSTAENTFARVDAGPGLTLTTSRDHMVMETSSDTIAMGVTILGLPYVLQFSNKGWPKVFIRGDKTVKNSLYRLATYQSLDSLLFNNYGKAFEIKERNNLTIACR